MTYKTIANHAEIDLFIKCAFQWVGTPYRWGGDDPSGIDCSGLVQECLESIGRNPPGGDKTADGIYRAMAEYARPTDFTRKGCVLFFGTEDKITHTAISISKNFMVEAGGGGSKTVSEEAAWAHNAWVRVRPVNSRSDLVASLAL